MQRIVNNGSFLQAYALMQTIKQICNAEVEFIDFPVLKNSSPEKKRNGFLWKLVRKIRGLIIPKYRGFAKTVYWGRKYYEMMHECQKMLGVSDEYHFPTGQYDLVIIGSDEVFNLGQYFEGYSKVPWQLLGEEVHTRYLISYAASCGQTTFEVIKHHGATEHCQALLKNFSALSVRDDNTYAFVKALCNTTPWIHIDPVLLLPEFPPDNNYKHLKTKYLLIYAYSQRIQEPAEIQAIKQYASKHKLQTVCINCFQTWCDKYIVCSPFALLQYFQEATCVVTDTFHGTVFSIRNKVPFATIIRDSNSNKLRYLLKQFNLSSRKVKDIKTLPQILDTPIDFTAIEHLLTSERNNAFDYLKTHIEKALS